MLILTKTAEIANDAILICIKGSTLIVKFSITSQIYLFGHWKFKTAISFHHSTKKLMAVMLIQIKKAEIAQGEILICIRMHHAVI